MKPIYSKIIHKNGRIEWILTEQQHNHKIKEYEKKQNKKNSDGTSRS